MKKASLFAPDGLPRTSPPPALPCLSTRRLTFLMLTRAPWATDNDTIRQKLWGCSCRWRRTLKIEVKDSKRLHITKQGTGLGGKQSMYQHSCEWGPAFANPFGPHFWSSESLPERQLRHPSTRQSPPIPSSNTGWDLRDYWVFPLEGCVDGHGCCVGVRHRGGPEALKGGVGSILLNLCVLCLI